MKSRSRVPAILVGVVWSAGAAVAQAPASPEPRQNPNVPAITGDRQQVPMGNNPAETPNAARPSATGLTPEQRPRLREYALKHREGELRVRDDIGVGTVLPETAILIDIPSDFGLGQYRLALANQKTLLVDPATRRVVEVIN